MAECPSRRFEMEERERDRAAEKEMVDEGRGVMGGLKEHVADKLRWIRENDPGTYPPINFTYELLDEYDVLKTEVEQWKKRFHEAHEALSVDNAALRKKLIEEQAVAEERGKAVLENIALRKEVERLREMGYGTEVVPLREENAALRKEVGRLAEQARLREIDFANELNENAALRKEVERLEQQALGRPHPSWAEEREKRLRKRIAALIKELGIIANGRNWFHTSDEAGGPYTAWRGKGEPDEIAQKAIDKAKGNAQT